MEHIDFIIPPAIYYIPALPIFRCIVCYIIQIHLISHHNQFSVL